MKSLPYRLPGYSLVATLVSILRAAKGVQINPHTNTRLLHRISLAFAYQTISGYLRMLRFPTEGHSTLSYLEIAEAGCVYMPPLTASRAYSGFCGYSREENDDV